MRQQTAFPAGEGIWALRLGFWSSLFTTLGGVIYFLVILGLILAGQFTFPPPDAVQLFGGITSLIIPPALIIVFASLHTVAPPGKKAFSQISLAFILLFTMAVSINRFTQLGVVRQSLAQGGAAGIDWFLPYGDHSVMLGLEMLGWDWFLGLGLIFAAPLFSGDRVQSWLRGLLLGDGVLCLVAAVGFLLGSPLSLIGFFAWGLVLFIITALMAVYFKFPNRSLP
jgi:hypothetical protein